MADVGTVRVTVLYALPDDQVWVELDLPAGARAVDAVRAAGLLERSDRATGEVGPLGLFGRVIAPDYTLEDGDRVEILRRLRHDPKETRRRLAAMGRTMGRRR